LNIGTTVKAVQDIMRQDVGVDGDAQRLGQLVWMLFLKILDDQEIEWEAFDPDYQSPVPEKLRWRSWAANDEGITGARLKEFIDTELFPGLQTLGDESPIGPLGHVVRSLFSDSFNYMKSGQLIRQVVNRLQSDVNMNESRARHTFGDMYEQLLRSLQNAGTAGEFYTPRAVTAFIVDRLDPKLHEMVIDPACGTGGFLTGAVEHKRANYVRTAEDEAVIGTTITGIEKKPLPHALAITNMILHGVQIPEHIRRDNTLSRPLVSWGQNQRYDVIAANPPFGGTEEAGVENNFPADVRTRETADLFMALFMKILKPGGRAGVVLPDGFLAGDGVKQRLKERLFNEFNLHTIVRLPKGVFSPYTDIRTNLLFFTKGGPTREVWFYDHPYPEGYKTYSKTRPMRESEFLPEKEWWGDEADGFASRVENDYAWRVSADEIRAAGYNLDLRNPNIGALDSKDPRELLEDFKVAAKSSAAVREQLQAKLLDTSGHNERELLADHLDLVTSSEGGTQKLRQLILQLAARGRLIAQNPGDEPAAHLLERTDAERMVGNAGLKKSVKYSTPTPVQDPLYDLPASWAWRYLPDVADYRMGKTPPTKDPQYWSEDSGIPWVSIADMEMYGTVDATRRQVSELASTTTFSHPPIPAGTILMSFKLTIGKVALLGMDAFHNEAIISVVPHAGLSKEFLFRLLPIFAASGNSKDVIMGGTLNSKSLGLIQVPVPPYAEQERIVERIDELFELLDELAENMRIEDGIKELLATSLTSWI